MISYAKVESDLILKREGRFVYQQRVFESYADKLNKEAEKDSGRVAAVGLPSLFVLICRTAFTTTLPTTSCCCSTCLRPLQTTILHPSSSRTLASASCMWSLEVVASRSWNSITSATLERALVRWRELLFPRVIVCTLPLLNNSKLCPIRSVCCLKTRNRNNLFFESILLQMLTSWVSRSIQQRRGPYLRWGCREERCSYKSAKRPQNLLLADDNGLGVAEHGGAKDYRREKQVFTCWSNQGTWRPWSRSWGPGQVSSACAAGPPLRR